jgi:glycosyltransferase involved in cell wall biosynthesis/SAM-dependent methyltransferase
MRVAFVSPMPPSKSGIADYAAALAGPLAALVDLTIIAEKPAAFDAGRFDAILYHAGNNPHHGFVYELALEHPGVVVMHEANLHHLIADLTIKRDDWEGYLREAEYNGGAAALEYARRVRALEVGPDYDGLPMLRRLLERSKAVVAHSRFTAGEIRNAGFAGPVAVIPHGAWIPEVDRLAWRSRLGLDEWTPLIGTFGFLKPYKRIAQSLRAFRRLVRVEPAAKMILVGEPHPELPLAPLIRSLGLQANVRLLGFVPIEDFAGYIAACDIVLNLRYPTVGESSGSLVRALGLGRAVLVSDVASFRELPDDICLKAPADETEEDCLFEYLNLLVSRPAVACEMGARAKRWVERECAWSIVARRYAEFLEAVVEGRTTQLEETRAAAVSVTAPAAGPNPVQDVAEEVLGWASRAPEGRAYAETHLSRLEKTLAITPPGGPEDRILEMGAYLQITPLLKSRLGYGEVRGCYYGLAGTVDHREVTSSSGDTFTLDLELFDAEKDAFPYPDGYFTTVLCCELIEHLQADPMHMMAEINRILKPEGRLVLTTPNIGSLRAIAAVLQGYHPGFFPAYLRPAQGEPEEDRHNREYTPKEVQLLLNDAGFEIELLETGPFRDRPSPELEWVRHMLRRYLLSTDLRGDGIYAVGCKTGAVRKRYPDWLYSGHK